MNFVLSKENKSELLDIVKKIYDIEQDDAKLRQVLEMKEEKRSEYFNALRKNYPIRREFQNTKVVIKDKNSSLARKLKGIGFKVKS